MNRYQVILGNNDMLQVIADGVNRDGSYLWFYEFVKDADGSTALAKDGSQEIEVNKVAEFAAWNGWNYLGPWLDPKDQAETPVKATQLTGADIAEQLRQAVAGQAKGDREPKVSYDPQQAPPGFDPYRGRS